MTLILLRGCIKVTSTFAVENLRTVRDKGLAPKDHQ